MLRMAPEFIRNLRKTENQAKRKVKMKMKALKSVKSAKSARRSPGVLPLIEPLAFHPGQAYLPLGQAIS